MAQRCGETRSDARVASEGPALLWKNAALLRRARACPSPCVWRADLVTSVGQDRLILTRSGSGDPELQRWAQCLPVFARPPRPDKYRNGVMKYPRCIDSSWHGAGQARALR